MPKTRKIYPLHMERLMVFIDGGYLRETMKELLGDDTIDWIALRNYFIEKFNELGEPFGANLIRMYYYDGIVLSTDRDYQEKKKYFEKIRNKKQYTVRLGEAVRDGQGKLRQKGVDILMAIDSLTRAYENHFDAAILITGDRDFVPLIKALKETGKKIYGFYYHTAPRDLKVEFDVRHKMTKKDFKVFHEK